MTKPEAGTIANLLDRLATMGGAAVSSCKYSEAELFHARATGRFYVNDDGLGYIWESEYWRKRAQEANESRRVIPMNLTDAGRRGGGR